MCAAIGNVLARFLNRPTRRIQPPGAARSERLRALLKPGDVLLVEGNTRIGTVIRYLTQSTWSHAAMYVGEIPGVAGDGADPSVLIEADLVRGVCAVPLSAYAGMRTRICRPTGLSQDDVSRLVGYMVRSLGKKYDLKNLFDLARYFLPLPPVPSPWRRELLRLGSGEPTRAICSTLIAQAFQSIRYPVVAHLAAGATCDQGENDVQQAFASQPATLCVPRDFDISPYFSIVKPDLDASFDFRRLRWAEPSPSVGPSQCGEPAMGVAAN
jgi:hypothetical protein